MEVIFRAGKSLSHIKGVTVTLNSFSSNKRWSQSESLLGRTELSLLLFFFFCGDARLTNRAPALRDSKWKRVDSKPDIKLRVIRGPVYHCLVGFHYK